MLCEICEEKEAVGSPCDECPVFEACIDPRKGFQACIECGKQSLMNAVEYSVSQRLKSATMITVKGNLRIIAPRD